jgi:hypothetical protein
MKLQSKPLRFLVTRIARAYGFLDPVMLMARLRGFSQESEVSEPIELLRAGMLFHARGLVNTKAIQHNLDWIWPYWVERQFNPDDPSFIPRAFSFSHINLTQRNWTAVGQPDIPFYPIVDPRGLVTPLFDGWSLDFWFIPAKGEPIFPSKLGTFEQQLVTTDNLRVRSTITQPEVALTSEVELIVRNQRPFCQITLSAAHLPPGHVAVALRPYNPEGVSLVNRIEPIALHAGWIIDRRHDVRFARPPARTLFSTYAEGDVSHHLDRDPAVNGAICPAGMATAAALFPAAEVVDHPLVVEAAIYDELKPAQRIVSPGRIPGWTAARDGLARLTLPEPKLQRLYDIALAGVVLHSPEEVFPGPYTYKRFWFRDAVFIMHTLLTLGGVERVRRTLALFHTRQRRDGYFLSQEGEWDSNGEALWMYARFAKLTGFTLPDPWLKAVAKGARWLRKKRLPDFPLRPEAGLLPAGFSAEHLGPNDFYYWDDFWAAAGLQGAAALLEGANDSYATSCRHDAVAYLAAIERSIPAGPHRRFPAALPASPYRRMDAGAIGSIVADYPLQLYPAADSRMLATADFLRNHCFRQGVFMQEMIHSGLNIYLTIHLAQLWLRAGQPELVWPIIDRVADLASPTGQWPEAIHPRTHGGCMGDGEHIWAAAEWLMLLRNLLLREEGNHLVVGAGINPEWLEAGELSLGRTLTPHGPVGVRFNRGPDGVSVVLDPAWRAGSPALDFQVPGCTPLNVEAGDSRIEFQLSFFP